MSRGLEMCIRDRKNALDYAYPEWARKPVAFVAYGAVGGARAVEHLRLIAVELQAVPLRNAVHIGMAEFLGMLQQGKKDRPGLPFVAGDGTRLPFLDDTFDAVTISYGLRNFVDPVAGLKEMHRVTRPGGRLVVCEFSRPTNAALRTVYLDGFMQALPRIASLTASAADAYVYLAESIRAWPDQAGLAAMMAEAGWQQPEWRNLTGGIVALHRATA